MSLPPVPPAKGSRPSPSLHLSMSPQRAGGPKLETIAPILINNGMDENGVVYLFTQWNNKLQKE